MNRAAHCTFLLLLMLVSSSHENLLFANSIDSLQRTLQFPVSKKERLNTLLKLSRLYADRNPVKSYALAKEANILAKALHDKLSTSISYRWMANYFELHEIPFDSAAYYYHLSMYGLQNDQSPEGKAAYLLFKTYSAGRSGIQSNEENLKTLNQAFSLLKKTHNNWLKAEVADRIAHAWWQKGFEHETKTDYEKSLTFWRIAQEHHRLAGYHEGVLSCLSKQAVAYISMQEPEKAAPILIANLREFELLGNTMKLANTKMNLGNYFFGKKDFSHAEELYLSAVDLYKQMNFRGGYGWTYNQLIELYKQKNNYKKALEYFDKRIELVVENMENVKQREVYKIRNDYEKKIIQKKLGELQIENKWREIEIQNSYLYLFLVVAALVFVVCLFIFIFIVLNKRQKFRTLHAMMQGQEEERARLAAELHDGLGGLISALKMNIEDLSLYSANSNEKDNNKFENALKLLDNACAEVRTISQDLLPILLGKHGLKPALSDMIRQLNQSSKIQIKLDYHSKIERFKKETELHVYRMVLELLNNILKHSNARNATIRWIEHEEHFNLIAEDDGTGFDPEIQYHGLGLKNLKNRVKILGGKIVFDTHVNAGTTAIIQIPKRNVN